MLNFSSATCAVGILQAGQYINRNSQLPDNRLSDLAEILPTSLFWQYLTLVKIQVNSTFQSGDIEFTFRVFYRPARKPKHRHILVSKIIFCSFLIEIKDLSQDLPKVFSKNPLMGKKGHYQIGL